MKPLRIGISACYFHADPKRPVFKGKTLLYLEESLAHWTMSQGALAYLIPSTPVGGKVTARDLVAELDGLVLQGGSDVSPKSYGETALRPEWNGDYVRDRYEIELVKRFTEAGKPVLGVCRGAQLLNVAYGGTLYQDIETQVEGAINHRNWDIYDQNFHTIRIEEGSGLARLYPGSRTAKINTVHHQGLKDLGKGFVVEARAEKDGVIEAIRLKGQGSGYVFAVQWHPEFHDVADQTLLDGAPILREFLDEAQKKVMQHAQNR
jgi:putative glutamine amidotransferase